MIFKVFLFRLPSAIWSFFISLNGFDLAHVTQIIMSKVYLDEYSDGKNWTKTQNTIEAVGEHLRLSFLKQKFQPHKRFRGFGKKKMIKNENGAENENENSKLNEEDKARMRQVYPNLRTKASFPLFLPYLWVKLVYLANLAFNFWFLSAVFGFDYCTYGYEFVRLLVTGQYQFANKYFPKRSACFPKVLSKDREQPSMIICALPINLINEYFYAAYWYLFLYLLFIFIHRMMTRI